MVILKIVISIYLVLGLIWATIVIIGNTMNKVKGYTFKEHVIYFILTTVAWIFLAPRVIREIIRGRR